MPKRILKYDYSPKEKISDNPTTYLVDGKYLYRLVWFDILGNREYRLKYMGPHGGGGDRGT